MYRNRKEIEDSLRYDIGLGWIPTVADLIEEIEKIHTDWSLDQVKEKFGGLRFYYSTGSTFPEDSLSKVELLVSAAENKCDTLCEVCGAPGKVRSSMLWLKCLCLGCMERSNDRSAV